MDIDNLTPALLKKTLESFQEALPLPAEWSQLQLLVETGLPSASERAFWFHDWLHAQVWEHLQQLRQQANLPLSPVPITMEEVHHSLSTDFRVNQPALEAWSAVYHRFLARFPHPTEKLAELTYFDPRQMRRRLETGLRYLTEGLQRAEMHAQQRTHTAHLRRYLPPPDFARLFGVETLLEKVLTWFAHAEGPRFVSLEGMGGLGKTALAQHLAHLFSEQLSLAGIVWISTRQEWMTETGVLKPVPDAARTLEEVVTRLAQQLGQEHLAGLPVADKLARLAPLLSTRPYLIVLDNLETLVDVETLLPALYPLAGATRFLLTSRATLHAYPYVQVLPLPELGRVASQALLENELTRRGQPALLSPKQMDEVYQVVGGLPLALKLIAAQLEKMPFDEVLHDLHQAKARVPEQLYTFLYRRTWLRLETAAKQLLLAMLLVPPEGEEVSWLQKLSQLSEADFLLAHEQLLQFSLLEVSGSLAMPIYRLHRLTTTFLHTDILADW
jgi:hypothetical protein